MINRIAYILLFCFNSCGNYENPGCPEIFEHYPACESREFMEIQDGYLKSSGLCKVKINSWVKTSFDQDMKSFKVPKFFYEGYISRSHDKIYYQSKQTDAAPCLLMDFSMPLDIQITVEGTFQAFFPKAGPEVLKKKYQMSRISLSSFSDPDIVLFKLEDFGFLRFRDDLFILADKRKGPIGWFTAVSSGKDEKIFINSYGGNISELFTYCSNFVFCPGCHE